MSSTKFYSNQQEQKTAGFLGWNVVPGSGSRNCKPGDIQPADLTWLGECKTHETRTPNDRIAFNLSYFEKICTEAESTFRRALLITDNGTQIIDYTWCMFKCSSISTADFCNVIHDNLNSVKVSKASVSFQHKLLSQEISRLRLQDEKQLNITPVIPLIKVHIPLNDADVFIMPLIQFQRLLQEGYIC